MTLHRSQIFLYSLLAFPLSFVGLPIYINISDFYAKEFGLSLSLIGIILILVRFIDIAQDIFVGYISDKLAFHHFYRKKIISFSVICLAILFYGLFNPPQFSQQWLVILWFFIVLTLTYTFFNFVVINYEAIAAIIAKNEKQRVAINSAKEFSGLLGFLTATILPHLISSFYNINISDSYIFLGLFFAVIVICANFMGIARVRVDSYQTRLAKKINVKKVFSHKEFLFFLTILLINGMAVSLPSASIIFYVEDVLLLKNSFGKFLAVYFLSAILFIFWWKFLLQKYDRIKIWIISIIGSILTFFFAFLLDSTTANYFYLICFFSGIFLGPDLINPPAFIATITQKNKNEISSFFAMFNMTNKIALMIASSSALLILGFFEYKPGGDSGLGISVIPYVYAVLPCFLKIIVVILLLRFSKFSLNSAIYAKNRQHP